MNSNNKNDLEKLKEINEAFAATIDLAEEALGEVKIKGVVFEQAGKLVEVWDNV